MSNYDIDNWSLAERINSKQYQCGHCSEKVASGTGYYHRDYSNVLIYICPHCGKPTFFLANKQIPKPLPGRSIKNLPQDINDVYGEMRESYSAGAYTGVVLLGRKLIMHLAAVNGANQNQSFESYVNYLGDGGYVPPPANKSLGYIRKIGNQKNHELILGTENEAQKVTKFVESLLYFLYELKDDLEIKEDEE